VIFTKKKIFLLTFIAIVVAFRLCLPVIAKNYINRQLNQDPLYHGNVSDVRIHLWRGAYSIVGLDIQRVKGQKDFPLLAADSIDIGVSWKELVHRAIRMKLEIKNLAVNIVQEQEGGQKKVAVGRDSKEGKKEEAQDWKTTFKKLVPIDVGRLSIDGKSIHFRDLTANPKVNVYLDHLEVRAENLTNSAKISQDLFGSVDIRARAMESGDLHIVLYVNPLVSPPMFKVTTQMKGLELTRLNDFFTAYGNFDVKSGTLGIYSEMATADKNLKGYVKPIIKDLKVSDLKKDTKKGGVFHATWEVIVGAVGGIFKNHHKDQQAARISFEGRLDDPKTSGWDTAKSVIYNMFVKPISPKVDHSVKMVDVEKSKGKS
jgi:hypothetical protein